MGGSAQSAFVFLIQTLFQLYLFAVLLRLLLQWVGTNPLNPILQFTTKITEPPLRPLRRFINKKHRWDYLLIIYLVALQMLSLVFISLIKLGTLPKIVGLLVWSIGTLLHLTFNFFFYAILIIVILSWVSPGAYNPVTDALNRIVEPLMRPARRMLPTIGGIDLSPLVVIIALQFLSLLLVNPISGYGQQLAFL